MWLKGLVALACVAIIAGVGVYFWDRSERSNAETQSAVVEREAAVANNCRRIYRDLADGKTTQATFATIANCLDSGDIEETALRAVPDGRSIVAKAAPLRNPPQPLN